VGERDPAAVGSWLLLRQLWSAARSEDRRLVQSGSKDAGKPRGLVWNPTYACHTGRETPTGTKVRPGT
jgi:hypothetical protein